MSSDNDLMWYVFLGGFDVKVMYISEHFHAFDGGIRVAFGENATAHLFTSFPHKNISWTTGFFDVVSMRVHY